MPQPDPSARDSPPPPSLPQNLTTTKIAHSLLHPSIKQTQHLFNSLWTPARTSHYKRSFSSNILLPENYS
ncbi:hypothetical protein HRI_000520200 [Hibiscus trionum]|uniref:Uncharacterized protein n=1 Tax=Hibiscus trionum TaxID=183268 RepID=A0A9W7LL96_HIBTR|nr:hypothetical protein HRI_000520200 [Hibiscus trionum]